MEFSIIIPTCNRNSILYTTLENTISAADKFTTNYEIIVVNDGDSDIEYSSEKVIIAKNKKKGVASARNAGVSFSRSENIIFLDDDIMLTGDALQRILSFFKDTDKKKVLNISWAFPPELIEKMKHTSFGRFLISIKYTEMRGWMEKNSWKENEEYITENLASYCLAINKSEFNNVGGYNEVFPYAGFEDYDFSQRAKAKGIIPLLNTKLSVWHNEADRIAPRGWFKRRFREGVTRAVYVEEMKNQNYAISPGVFKRMLYSTLLVLFPVVIFWGKCTDRMFFLDIITQPFYRALTGAEIYSGYRHYGKKN